MSVTTMAEMDCTTDRVVTRPTPSAPPLTEAPLTTPMTAMRTAKMALLPNSPLKKALLTGFHSTAKHNATKAVSPSSETMRTI